MTVQEVPADAILITDSSEVSHLRSMFELLESEAFDSFFVIVKDGDYAQATPLIFGNVFEWESAVSPQWTGSGLRLEISAFPRSQSTEGHSGSDHELPVMSGGLNRSVQASVASTG